MLGATEVIIVAGVVVLLFGSTAIPKFFRAIGKARNEFEAGAKEAQLEDTQDKEKNGVEV